jgi:hypothetical protein
MSLEKYLQAPWGLDRRDSAIRKEDGLLYELQNLMIDEGSMRTREGLTRYEGLNVALDDGTHRILALHRYVGVDAETGDYTKEFYAAINQAIKKWNTVDTQWDTLALPPGIDSLAQDEQGTFRQLRDRTYYSNYEDPVLMIKKGDDKVYEAGIPNPDAEKEIFDCESLTVSSVQKENNSYTLNTGEWTIFTNGEIRNIQYYLDPGFDKHTKGDYGITLVQHEAGKTLKAIHKLSTALNLDWFFGPISGNCDLGATGNTLYDAGATFTEREVGQEVVKDDGTRGIVTEWVNAQTLRTTLSWANGDGYEIGGPASVNDYIALEVFRWNKIDIDEVVVEFSSQPPDNYGDFPRGFRAVIYSDTGFEHFHLKQRTMMAEWANNPHGNRIFYCKFRKRWFVPISDSVADDWDSIQYVKVHVMQNSQSSAGGPARITFDNIRLLKTPPLAAQLKLQVATCDATEIWSANAGNDYARATEGMSCKSIAAGQTVTYDFDGGVKNLQDYGDGTSIDGSDMFIFDICGTGLEITQNVSITITLTGGGKTAVGTFISAMNFRQPQERALHVQEFLEQPGFDWSIVTLMTISNPAIPTGFPVCYIDNIRIQPPTATKVINSFLAVDMRIAEGVGEFVDHLFGQNKVVDTITDWLFHAWANFRVQGTGQGEFDYPNQEYGRYKFGDFSSACLAIGAQAGGSYSVNFIQNTDLTEYNEFNFNLDAFFHPKEYSDTHFFGLNWVEIPASDNDVISIWVNSPDWAGVNKITFRFYTNQRAQWSDAVKTSTHSGSTGRQLVSTDTTNIDFRGKTGKRIRNDTTGQWGIIGWAPILAGNKHICSTWGITWNNGDEFSYDGWSFGNAGQRPVPDTDDYYEYVFDVRAANAKVYGLFDKSVAKRLSKYPVENQEVIEDLRTILREDGFEFITRESEGTGGTKGWVSAVISWKRGDMVHHSKSASPFASWQSIASHQIIVEATTKKTANVAFQDWIIKKKGAIRGEVAYKVRLEDDQGYLGPISTKSANVSVKGNDVQVSDIYVPYDTRIHRKRLYRTDVNGEYRYLDTIDRDDREYTDTVPEDLLGEPIEEEAFRPPKARIMEVVQNRMAYADIIDRDGRYRPSRVQLSLPFRPHQCSDDDVFDVVPENGQRITGFKYYNGIYYCWKEKSFWTVDPGSFRYQDRDKTKGNIAPLALTEIPGIGFGWFTHEGPALGHANEIDYDTGRFVWDDLEGYDLSVLAKAVGFYHDDYWFLFAGNNNELGYALHLPTRRWFYVSGWNVQCVNIWGTGEDNRIIYAGSDYGYINRLLNGNTDLTDDVSSTVTAISWAFRTLDYDFMKPGNYKYPRYMFTHAKNLIAGGGNEVTMTVTPYFDQVAGSAYPGVQFDRTTYYQYLVKGRHPTIGASGEKGSLIGMRVAGTGRCAFRDFFIESGDLGFRPNLC